MKRAAKVLGFFLAASMLVGACGGDDSSTTEISTVDTITSDITSDTTADEGDRDRNVQVGGWGNNSSGVSTTKVDERTWSSTRSSVFRRQRVETDGERRVVFGTDVFVVSRLMNMIGARTEATMTVAGFDTSANEIAQYPIESIGDSGVVQISLTDKGTDWNAWPSSWTVISRGVLAMFFRSTSDAAETIGIVEYYDLTTGRLATTIGDDGRTTVPASLGMDFVMEIGVRSVDDDGTPHLLVVGSKLDGEKYTDIVVAGFTPDGKPDLPGGGSDGTITIAKEAIEGEISWASLADPGLGVSDGSRIGVVVHSKLELGEEGEAETHLNFLVIGVDADLGALAYPGTGSFNSVYVSPQDGLPMWNVAFSAPDRISAHVTTQGPDGEQETILDFGRNGGQVSDAAFNWPDESNDDIFLSRVIVDVAEQGKKFVVGQATSFAKGLAIVCFNVGRCDARQNRVEVPIGIEARDTGFTLSELMSDGTGVQFVVGKRGERTGQTLFSLASLDATGANFTSASDQFDDVFEKDEVDPDTSETIASTGLPLFIGSGTVVAMKKDYQPAARTVLVKQKTGDDATVVTPSLPLGIERYVDNPNLVARLGDAGVALAVNVVNSDTGVRERRLYRVSTDNGSVDTAFGTDGYVQSPVPVEDDNCDRIDMLLGGPSSITSLIVDYDQITPDPADGCSNTPVEVTWQTFSATGAAVSTPSQTALSDLGDGEVLSWAADAQGNLFALVNAWVIRADDTQESELRVAKFTPAGKLDPTFGKGGIAVVKELANSSQQRVAVDAVGHVYVGGTTDDEIGNINLTVVRLSVAGVLDVAVEVSPTTTTQPVVEPGKPEPSSPAAQSIERDERNADSLPTSSPARDERAVAAPNASATIIGSSPVLAKVTTDEDRSLSVEWQMSVAAGKAMVVATAMPGGRTCASDLGSCVIRGLDPAETYTVTVALKDAPKSATAKATATSVAVKPIIVLKAGRVASPTTYLRPASKGKATWKVRGGCTLNPTNTRLTAPKSPTTCQLSVTTAKFGSTPKTTKSVTIVVKK